jgi:hypothetical protein
LLIALLAGEEICPALRFPIAAALGAGLFGATGPAVGAGLPGATGFEVALKFSVIGVLAVAVSLATEVAVATSGLDREAPFIFSSSQPANP